MTEPIRCPQCAAEIPPNAPAGLCPKCLFQAGLESQPGVAATQSSPVAAGFVPPSLAEMAQKFPQLEILELLGKGGMGAVYKARQPGLDRFVAVKVLPPEVGQDPAFAERFTREARALARLSHPNIVAVYDFGQASGLYFFIMEYVDGVNLRQAIRTGSVSPKETLSIVPQICDALQFAHDEGIVHRDIKPENVLIDKRGRVKIADFGLAKLMGQERVEGTLTGTHQVMGTLRYMAPEQMEGSREVDHRADIYSLGVVFYELLTGEVPMGRFAPPSKTVQIDVRLDEIVLRALEREPQQRYQHASELKTEVEGIRQSAAAINAAGIFPPATPPNAVVGTGPVSPPSSGEAPRFSRLAIIAAIWAPLFFLFMLGSLVSYSSRGPDSRVSVQPTTRVDGKVVSSVPDGVINAPPDQSSSAERAWWQWILMYTLVPLGLASPFGTTIVGAIALTQIRHSRGRLYGLWLALCDVLFYPLLAVDAIIAYLLLVTVPAWIFMPMIRSFSNTQLMLVKLFLVFSTIVLILVIDVLVILFASRAARTPAGIKSHQSGATEIPKV